MSRSLYSLANYKTTNCRNIKACSCVVMLECNIQVKLSISLVAILITSYNFCSVSWFHDLVFFFLWVSALRFLCCTGYANCPPSIESIISHSLITSEKKIQQKKLFSPSRTSRSPGTSWFNSFLSWRDAAQFNNSSSLMSMLDQLLCQQIKRQLKVFTFSVSPTHLLPPLRKILYESVHYE